MEQMQDNLSYMRDFQPLDEEEQKVIQQAQRILGHSSTIPCTACIIVRKGARSRFRSGDFLRDE